MVFCCYYNYVLAAKAINNTAPRTSLSVMSTRIVPTIGVGTPIVRLYHLLAMLFTIVIVVFSVLLGIQYIFRYRKYQLTANVGELDSPAHTPRTSLGSITTGQLNSRAVSTSTLISEVVSFVKIRPCRGRWMKHSRLRESIDGEAYEQSLTKKKAIR